VYPPVALAPTLTSEFLKLNPTKSALATTVGFPPSLLVGVDLTVVDAPAVIFVFPSPSVPSVVVDSSCVSLFPEPFPLPPLLPDCPVAPLPPLLPLLPFSVVV